MRLDVGCGSRKDGDVGLDVEPGPNADIVCDITKAPWTGANGEPVPGGWDSIVMHQVLEHLPLRGAGVRQRDDPIFVVAREVYRLLKPGGVWEFDVPHFRGWGGCGNPLHVRFYNERSFGWLLGDDRFLEPDLHNCIPRFELSEPVRLTRSWEGGWLNVWHFRRYAPSFLRALYRLKLGIPDVIYVKLRKPYRVLGEEETGERNFLVLPVLAVAVLSGVALYLVTQPLVKMVDVPKGVRKKPVDAKVGLR